MDDLEPTGYLRSVRRRAGFSQRELAHLIGYLSHDQVSRHERGENLPSILVALAYESIFRVSVSRLFPSIAWTVEQGIEERLATLESTLLQTAAKGRKAPSNARKLEWFYERNGSAATASIQ
jgi:DNA-binding XRE family transcriptional regulator